MKKIYATIFATLLGSATMLAQEETTFAFAYNGEVVPNGSVITVTHVDVVNLGAINIYEMHIDLKVKNVSEDASKVRLVCEGIENYDLVQFCPNGSCQGWAGNTELSTEYNAVQPDALADNADWLHVSSGVSTATSFTYDGTVVLKAYPPLDDEDCATVTVHFDTAGTEGIQSLNAISKDQQVEVFNLCGKKVATQTMGLPKGIYIIRQGNTSRKVTIK